MRKALKSLTYFTDHDSLVLRNWDIIIYVVSTPSLKNCDKNGLYFILNLLLGTIIFFLFMSLPTYFHVTKLVWKILFVSFLLSYTFSQTVCLVTLLAYFKKVVIYTFFFVKRHSSFLSLDTTIPPTQFHGLKQERKTCCYFN